MGIIRRAASSIRDMSSDIMGRLLWAYRAGLQFHGRRDLYEVYGYHNRPIFVDYLVRYSRQEIAQRVVNAYPTATWKKPAIVRGGDAFNKAWEDFVRTHRVYALLKRLDILMNLGHFAVLVFGHPDGKLEDPLSTQITTTGDPKNIVFLKPFSEGSATIQQYVNDIEDPRYGLPLFYRVATNSPLGSAATTAVMGSPTPFTTANVRVHYSRTIHIAEGLLENDVFGTPRLAPVFNLLDDFMKVVGGSAEMFWLNSRGGLQADVDKEMDLDEGDEERLTQEIENYQHNLARVIRTRGVKMNNLGANQVQPAGVFEMLGQMLSAATGIPWRILFGNEAGQLASEQDRAIWADNVQERQQSFAIPVILRPFIEKLIEMGALPKPEGVLEISFPSAFNMSPLEEDQSRAQRARSIANLSKQGVQGNQVITTLEEARELSGLPREMPKGDTQLLVSAPMQGVQAGNNPQDPSAAGNGAGGGTGAGSQQPGTDGSSEAVDDDVEETQEGDQAGDDGDGTAGDQSDVYDEDSISPVPNSNPRDPRRVRGRNARA